MKQVTIVVPKGYADIASIRGSFEILNSANDYQRSLGKRPQVEVCIAGFVDESKLDTGFFAIYPISIEKVKKSDLVIIPSVSHHYADINEKNKELIDWIKIQYKNGAEVASICTGAFLLAATSLLDGKICSTHWGAANDFKRLFPKINLQPDKLVTAENGIYTNGGSYSFLNLLLFLVGIYFDKATAIQCSKMFQIDIGRSLQSAFMIFESQKGHGDLVIEKAQSYIEQNISRKISFEQLAFQLATSRRNFDRRFVKATGNTPVEYLQRVKIEIAKSTLEKGRKSIFEVMTEVGYSDEKAFREVFKKITGLSPLSYRNKFNKENYFSQLPG